MVHQAESNRGAAPQSIQSPCKMTHIKLTPRSPLLVPTRDLRGYVPDCVTVGDGVLETFCPAMDIGHTFLLGIWSLWCGALETVAVAVELHEAGVGVEFLELSASPSASELSEWRGLVKLRAVLEGVEPQGWGAESRTRFFSGVVGDFSWPGGAAQAACPAFSPFRAR